MAATKRIDGDYTISVSDGGSLTLDTGVSGTTTIAGNLNVQGTTSTIDSATLQIEDNTILLNNNDDVGSTVTAGTAGIEIYRGGGNIANLLFDENGLGDPFWKTDIGLGGASVRFITAPLAQTGTPLFNVIEDTTPQLGADLDTNGSSIVSVTDQNISIVPNGTGEIRAGGPVVLQDTDVPSTVAASNVALYVGTNTGGETELHFKNNSNTGELISKQKAIAYAMIL